MTTTSVSGHVYDPAGKVPLYNAVVYVAEPGSLVDLQDRAQCEDCGAHAEWELSSVRENAVPPDTTVTGACHEHRLDATENLLAQYGNVTVSETLG